ncbi:hypothetical protein IE81DRAFT_368684 [Ceraceosorus guamensis]|uniref:Uncharacterized protein n=1 Tax=Ceraceosorus guamensis TaxID=1522189 RepID=A0A316VSB0_9BASI|nr:hypothetical protein IE81DRAFT_368684 [Ceraceosorus guamensis]PWN39938.1 hypothetical protein IE81DRAFT_368684 [Ceraceosorus guamensis]
MSYRLLAFLASLLFSNALAKPLRNLCRDCLVHEPTSVVRPSEGAAETVKFRSPDASERDKLWRQDLEAISRSSLHALRSGPRSATPGRLTSAPSPSRSSHGHSLRSANPGGSPTSEVGVVLADGPVTTSSRTFAHYTTPRTSVARLDHSRSPKDSGNRGYASGSDAPTSPGLRSSSSALSHLATASPRLSTTPGSREARLFAQTQRELRTALSGKKALQHTSEGRGSRRLDRASTAGKGKSPDGNRPQSASDRWSGASQDQTSTPIPSRQASIKDDDSERSSRWSMSDRYSQLRSLSPSPSPPHSIRRQRDAYSPSPQRSPMHSPLRTPSSSRLLSPSPQRFARLSPGSAVHGDRNVPNVVHPLGYAHPHFDSHGLYGQVNHNLEEHTHALQYDGHVKGTSLRGDSVAMWAKPGFHFRHFATGWMEQRHGSGQSKVLGQGPGQGKLLMVGPNNQFFDAVHNGKVVGSWKLHPSMSKQKGVYDIERNPVHVHGPKARANNQEALQTLQEMEAKHAHSSSRRRPSDSDDDADDGMDFRKPSPAGSRRTSRSSSPPQALASPSVSPARSPPVSSTRRHSPAVSSMHAQDRRQRDTYPRADGISSTPAKPVPDASPLPTATSTGEKPSVDQDAKRLRSEHNLKPEAQPQHSRASSPASSLGSADSFAFRVGPLLGAENGQVAGVANGEVEGRALRREHDVDRKDDSKQSAQRGDDRDPIRHAADMKRDR